MADPVARDTLLDIKQADERKGATVHSFDPNSTPQEKAARAGKARNDLKSATNGDPGASAREIKLDAAQGPPVQPTITVEDFDEKTEPPKSSPTSPSEPNGQPMPGTLSGPAPAIPDWYRVGWRAVSSYDKPLAEGEERERNIISTFVSDMYYGQWYHNAGVIFFAVLSTYFLTLFHLGWGWLIIVLATCSTYYSASIERVRRGARDDIQRELVKTRLATEHESAEWINNFLDRFWLIYEPVLSATIVSSVDQILSVSTPPMLDSLRLSTFTLGTKAPKIDRVRTFPRTADDVVLMDWGISFSSTDISDLTPNQLAGKVNSKIVLEIRVGKGLATAAIPVLVEDIEFSGELRIKLKLMTNFPHVQLVDISFLGKPVFNYVLKPIGGETFGFDINSIPGLSSFIRDMVHATLGPMMYDPNVFTLNLEQLLSGTPLDTAVGVLQVQVQSARGLKGAKIGGGTPDPYVSLSINNRAELARTKFKASTLTPHFGSTHYLLLNSTNLTETLSLTILDHNDHRKDTELGAASFELALLAEDATREGIVSKVLKDGKDRGEVIYNLSYFPVLTPNNLEGGGVEPVPETQVGIVRLTIHQAKELDASRSLSRDLNPLAKVLLRRQVVHKTPTYKHTVSPVWESATEFLVSDRSSSVITVKVIDDRDLRKDPVIGYLSVKLDDLLTAKEEQRDWFSLSGAKSGKVRMSAEWKPLAMAGSVQGAAAYSPPIGVIRLWLKKATDVKNIEATLGGKSDPYVRVLLHGITVARTDVINNNLNPEWDQIVYVPVHSLSEALLIETMDYQNLTKDRSLGYCELAVKDLAKQNVDDPEYPFEGLGKLETSSPIRLQGNVFKGQLHYVAEFVPALNMRGLTFESDGTELDGRGAGSGSGEDVASGDQTSESSSDEDAQAVPEGVTIKSNGHRAHHKGAKSTDTTKTAETAETAATADTTSITSAKDADGVPDSSPSPPPAAEGIELSLEDLYKSQSGVLIIRIISGELTKKARLELLLDDGYWPSFSTERARSINARWEQVGEGFIKELDFGRVWLRLNENEEGDKDDIIGELKMDAKAFLEQALNKVATFTLADDEGRRQSTVKLEARFVPVPVKLEARESINNMGSLRVDLLSAKDLRAVDRSGKSDPYAVFTLNDQKVFKSETKKKTLAPVWDENFTVMIPSRVASAFEVEIFDWDQIGKAETLGSAFIDLANLEPFQATELFLPIVHHKHGPKGEVRLRVVFNPEIVSRSRKNTSTFSVAGRAMTQVGSLPFGAARGVVRGVEGAGQKAFGLFGRDKTVKEEEEYRDLPPIPEPPSSQISQPAPSVIVAPNGSNIFPTHNTATAPGEGVAPRTPGSLRVTVASAKDLLGAQASDSVKPYVVVKLGEKDFKTKHTAKTLTPEWDESFTFSVGPETQTFSITVLDHKTLGKDKVLGEADIEIWRHIQPGGASPITAADVWAELREGLGLIHLRLEYDRAGSRNRTPSASVGSLAPRTPLGSPSRFSLSKRTPTSHDD